MGLLVVVGFWDMDSVFVLYGRDPSLFYWICTGTAARASEAVPYATACILVALD